MSIKTGDTVTVNYVGSFTDGEVFDSSYDREPITFVIGQENLIAGFENSLLGKSKGDKYKVEIVADDAYGEHLEELVIKLPKAELPEDIIPEEGIMLQINTDDGDMEVQIVEVTDDLVTLDANHPLAGEDLIFDIEILEVNA